MLKIEGKTFMNIQEAVQWLLDNNALPFQSSANYVANTEIGMGTIVNPSPAKVRIGSLIFFADSKVSTVIGLTENGFICSDQYNDLVDDVVFVSNVALNASGHLIVTLSNGDTIDAGLIKQVNNFSINASQHLIANYNDGTTTDLGAIFSGNVNIAGNLTADSIIENMSGYGYYNSASTNFTITNIYSGIVKNGNKLTLVLYFKINFSSLVGGYIGTFTMPSAVGANLYPTTIGGSANKLQVGQAYFATSYNAGIVASYWIDKISNTQVAFAINTTGLSTGVDYTVRLEATFLLSNNLAS